MKTLGDLAKELRSVSNGMNPGLEAADRLERIDRTFKAWRRESSGENWQILCNAIEGEP